MSADVIALPVEREGFDSSGSSEVVIRNRHVGDGEPTLTVQPVLTVWTEDGYPVLPQDAVVYTQTSMGEVWAATPLSEFGCWAVREVELEDDFDDGYYADPLLATLYGLLTGGVGVQTLRLVPMAEMSDLEERGLLRWHVRDRDAVIEQWRNSDDDAF